LDPRCAQVRFVTVLLGQGVGFVVCFLVTCLLGMFARL
jgi:hypothetical protein